MRWQTYWRLCSEQADLADVALTSMMQKLRLSLDSAGRSVSQKRG